MPVPVDPTNAEFTVMVNDFLDDLEDTLPVDLSELMSEEDVVTVVLGSYNFYMFDPPTDDVLALIPGLVAARY